MTGHVILYARTLEEAKAKARFVGQLKIESGVLYSRGSWENSYRFEKKE